MKWSMPASVRTYAGTSGKRHDKALAEELCDLQAIFWVPSPTWNWKSTSGSNRAGWMVQAISHREEDGDVLLNVRSLHHSDHHKYGDIRVNYTALVNARGVFASRYRLPKSVIPQRTRGQGNLPISRQRARHLSQLRGIKLPGRRTYHSVTDRHSPHR